VKRFARHKSLLSLFIIYRSETFIKLTEMLQKEKKKGEFEKGKRKNLPRRAKKISKYMCGRVCGVGGLWLI